MSELIRQEKPQLLQVFGHDFEQGQRIANVMVNSITWKQKFAYDTSAKAFYPIEVQVSTAMTILDIGNRLNIGWPEVIANGTFVHGTWTWKSEYIVAHVMNSPKYKDFEYVEAIDGKAKVSEGKEIDNWTCYLVGIRHDGKRDEGSEVSFQMAIKEGWWNRTGSKWQTMPRKMLRARAIAFFNREWPTATLLGFKSQDEQEDYSTDYTDAVVVESTPATPRKPKAAPATQAAAPTHVVTITEAVTIDDDLESAKETQRQLAAGDPEWTAAIDAATSVEDLERIQQEYDL